MLTFTQSKTFWCRKDIVSLWIEERLVPLTGAEVKDRFTVQVVQSCSGQHSLQQLQLRTQRSHDMYICLLN